MRLLSALILAAGCTTFQIAGEPEVVEADRAPNLAIPDDTDQGVTDIASIDRPCDVVSTEVDIEIRHTFRGDIFAELTSPGGKLVILKATTDNDDNNDLVGTFPTTLSSLQPLDYEGEDGMGGWQLKVGDLGEGDTGTLVSWTLRLECF